MTAMEKALEEMYSNSFLEEEGIRVVKLEWIIITLQEFEINLLKELEEEKLKQELC